MNNILMWTISIATIIYLLAVSVMIAQGVLQAVVIGFKRLIKRLN